jgi:signal transduction histidine kinase
VRLNLRVGRLAIQFGGLFALAMLAMGLVTFEVAEQRISMRIDDALEFHSTKFLAGPTGPRTAQVAARIRDWQRRKVLSERTYMLYDKAGRVIAGRLDLAPPPSGFSEVTFRGGGKSLQKGRALATRLPDGALFVVVQHSEAAESLRAVLPAVVLAIFASALAAGLAATGLFARQTAIRLAETQAAADAIAQGDLTRRISTARLDGMFAEQAASLNRMLDRMEDLVTTQRHFASALAHDLRTPLARLRGLLAAGNAMPQEALIERAERECASVIAIFDSLLRLAELETGRHPSAMATVALDELVEDVAETMEPVIADAGCALVTGPLASVVIKGDTGLLNQLLVNLLENVATHTPSGTRAMLSLRREAGDAVIAIADDGPGLAQEDRQRVLRPFERGQAAAGRRGSGLGLSIAQAIVRFHGGRLDLRDRAPGLEVRMIFPTVA